MNRILLADASWADLLLFRYRTGADDATLEAARVLLGLPQVVLPAREAAPPPTPPEDEPNPSLLPDPSSATSASAFRLPLRCPQGFAVRTEPRQRSDSEPRSLPEWNAAEVDEVERMLRPGDRRPPEPRSLLDRERLRMGWRRVLRRPQSDVLDVDRMVQLLARSEWPASLPRRPLTCRVRDVHVCIDWHPDRQYQRHDLVAFLRCLSAEYPRIRRHRHIIRDDDDWAPVFPLVGPGQVVLLLADPRSMSASDRSAWCGHHVRLTAQGASVHWALDWQIGAWNDASIKGAVHASSSSDPFAALSESMACPQISLDRLLACLAPAITIEPALIRAMIHALDLQGGLALEAAVWRHPDLDGDWPFRQWYPDRQAHHLQRLRASSPEDLDACGRVLFAWHGHRSQLERDEELLRWADAAGAELAGQLCEASGLEGATERFMRVARHLAQLRDKAAEAGLAGVSSPSVIRGIALDLWQALPDSLGQRRDAVAHMLLHAARPPSAASEKVSSTAPLPQAPLRVALRQLGQRLVLAPSMVSTPGPDTASGLRRDRVLTSINERDGPGMTLAHLDIDDGWLVVEQDGQRRIEWRLRSRIMQGAVSLIEWQSEPPQHLRLRTEAAEIRLDAVRRPSWATRVEQGNRDVYFGVDCPDGSSFSFSSLGPHGLQSDQAGWHLEMDGYGPRLSHPSLNARLNIDQPLYFRYLPPGTFLQGSPEGIGHEDEHPQHPVTLTQGLWLAETPCTQALWQAVMGKNPSHFKDGDDAPRRPVENVSWDDVTAFLKTLQPLLPPGCEAVLPTESQWEYACRAGTQTEFWWGGDEADDTRANWNQQHGGTTAVDRYPPNPWGLYDMHGNVWEWCADRMRDYAAEPARDPEGPGAGDFRVVRGGSWFFRPGYARAAYRYGWLRGDAYQGRGFRFALRSPSGPEARPGGPGASRRGGAAGGRTDGADAPAAEPSRRARDDEDTST